MCGCEAPTLQVAAVGDLGPELVPVRLVRAAVGVQLFLEAVGGQLALVGDVHRQVRPVQHRLEVRARRPGLGARQRLHARADVLHEDVLGAHGLHGAAVVDRGHAEARENDEVLVERFFQLVQPAGALGEHARRA
eukprot:CAMPEP_0174858174 /NCGR_PEP_ID=MMETSP1114-20130205/41663_1 /TAXON_ID=312471 /ORGANISM="Neobodo designis, Strain CCAP 1951/1" /LENGTH=134 /DNA_ID=CAMNT_0016093063 /DNA_START=112 /DNA_END=512 /DNA_ORIENTATION=+